MAVVSAPGIGSGLDGSTIISQLMAIESRTLDGFRQQQSDLSAQLSSFGKLKSAVSTFKDSLSDLSDADKFKQFSASSSNESAFTVTADASAARGSYSVTVNSLAYADKQASSAYADAATDIGGSGTLDITVDGNTSSISVAAGATLTDIRDAINQASDNPGVTASILNEVDGSRLILTSNETGVANEITLSTTDDDGNNADASGLSKLFYVGNGVDDVYAREVTAAKDASLTMDGFDITSTTNNVTGAIDGITIQLVNEGQSGTLSVSRDDEAIKDSVQSFVTAYNDLRSQLTSLYEGELSRDSSLRYIEQGLLQVVGARTTGTGTYSSLSLVGVTRDKYGVMSLDSTALTNAMNADFNSVVSLFTNQTEGIGARLTDFADNVLGSDGIISNREEGIGRRQRFLSDRVIREQLRLDAVEARLVNQFANLDTTMASLNSTNSYLMAQML